MSFTSTQQLGDRRSADLPSLSPAASRHSAEPAPRILLAATLWWATSARLSIALDDLGCEVHVWCPADHPAEKTRAVFRNYRASAVFGTASLRAAIEAAKPAFIIPCDDDAVRLMHELYADLPSHGSEASLRDLIAHSLGDPIACQRASARAELMHIAETAGVRIPPTRTIGSQAAIRDWAADIGFPAVVKVNGSWGGLGVVTVHNIDQARLAFERAMHPSWWDATKSLLLRRQWQPALRLLQRKQPVVTMQKFVRGRNASASLACWRGEVLAGVNFMHVASESQTGPATVVRSMDCAEMDRAARHLIKALGVSGLCGLDFIIEAGTGAAYLLEMNPRATPTCHLQMGRSGNLPRALLARISTRPLPTPIAPQSAGMIALFPGELRRNATSTYLRKAFHDVPWREPELVSDCIDTPWPERGLIARLRALFSPSRRRSRRRLVVPAAPGAIEAARGPNRQARPFFATRQRDAQ